MLTHNTRFICNLLFSCLFAGLFYACTEEDQALNSLSVPVTFTPSIGDITESSTRVKDNSWSGNETVGIYSVNAGGSLPSNATFKTYKPLNGVSGTRVQLTPTAEAQTIYYPANGSDVSFVAFAPYATPSSNTVTYNLYNQSSATTNSMESVDFIYHKGTTVYNQSSPVANLNFDHKLSRIIINLTSATAYTGTLYNITAKLINFPNRVTCNLSTGGVTVSRPVTNTIVPFRPANTSNSATFQAIIPPHSPSGFPNQVIEFTTSDGTTYSYKLAHGFEEGKSYTFNLEITPTGIVLAGSTVSSWIGGTTTANDIYNLSASKGYIVAYCEASNGQLDIETNYGSSSSDLVINASSSNTSLTTCSWLTITESNGYTLNYSISEYTGGSPRTGYIHIQAGPVKLVVTVIQYGASKPIEINSTLEVRGDANCHILPPGGKQILFPISRAAYYTDNYDNTHPKLSDGDNYTVQILWQDENTISGCCPAGTGPNGYILVESGPNEGNALIAVYKNGVILWSWHIWVIGRSYVESNRWHIAADGYSINMMAMDLGDSWLNRSDRGTGLVYQWGRKDPFRIENSEMNFPETYFPATSHKVTIQNPETFYYDVYRSVGWLADYNYHGGFESEIFDPCPEGWRVPSHDITNLIIKYSEARTGSYQGMWIISNPGDPIYLFSNKYIEIVKNTARPYPKVNEENKSWWWSHRGYGYRGTLVPGAFGIDWPDLSNNHFDYDQYGFSNADYGHSIRCFRELE